ncbi:non-homologous end joining protein Ku [Burkholderia sp. ISTR5]|uniref:non-homologous end joining protein Ku n=1 Tax=Burkholderia sp. ISTR5 TaxID=2500161 RepID=UPI0013685F2E|nr:Ku protein [Burkholderia sp. ISTR5]NBI48347.1 Ku protein [Burkholderia sp. ISTR5]
MPSMIWKGAVSFGLVHVPVQLVPATRTVKPSFRMLDRRSMDPIGYRRVNKRTGREVAHDDIVRGYEYEKERYVVLSDEEIRAANPESTQSVDILTFVEASAVSFLYLDTPYYLVPDRHGEKVYALLRDALVETGRIGIALVVMRDRQHLAALIPVGPVLALDTLRWQDELRPLDELRVGGKRERGEGLSARERKMAQKLIEDMSGDWQPDEYRDTFREDILALVDRKVKAGKSKTIETPHEARPSTAGSNVLDLTELLRRSLGGGGGRRGSARDGEAGEAAPRKRAGKAAGAARNGKAAKVAKAAKATKTAKATKGAAARKSAAKPTAARKSTASKSKPTAAGSAKRKAKAAGSTATRKGAAAGTGHKRAA